jgi:hypothetical protein
MNNQEAFNLMVDHLRKQQQRSQGLNDTTCMYRGPDGLKCAVGALIPDELYIEDMEGSAITRILIDYRDRYPALSTLFKDIDPLFLAEMQDIHDFNPIDQWERRFKGCAEDNDLVYTDVCQ